MEKQLVKFGFTKLTNYKQLVNLGFPTLFKFEEDNQVYIGFTNQYKLEKGILQFIISPANKKDIELYLQNRKTPNTLFNESKTTQYYLEKGERITTIINSNDLKNVLPSAFLTYDNPFNMVYIYN
jgi:hypothetical protein